MIPSGDKQNPAAEDVEIEVVYDDLVRAKTEIDGEAVMESHFEESVTLYKQLQEQGMAKEDVRMVLPVGTKVDLTFSAYGKYLNNNSLRAP